MREYSDDDLGARALNWVVIGGAALLFVLASFSSLTPLNNAEQQQQPRANITVSHGEHA